MKKLFSKISRSISYIFILIKVFKNWLAFLIDHAHIKTNVEMYKLRNGLKISLLRTEKGDWSTDMLMDIFIRKDYGEIKDNITIVDIGANVGVFALYSVYGHNNKCFSFEPELSNFKKLEENVKLNSLDDKIKVFNMAVAGDCSEKKLYKYESIAHSMYRESGEFDVVKSINIDSIISDNKIDVIDLLKIDCEGSEFEILYNTKRENFDKIRSMIIEYHNYSDILEYNGNALMTYLEAKGYEITDHHVVQAGLLGIFKALYSKSK